MREVKVLSTQRSTAAERARIEAVDPGVRLVDAGGWFDGEVRERWNDFAVARARAPRLKWFHQRQAGASNLFDSDLWGSDVVATTSRGASNPLPIAEYAVAGILHFAMGLHRASIDRAAGRFDHRAYRPLLVEGKTVCVIGAGGIGLQVGRLC